MDGYAILEKASASVVSCWTGRSRVGSCQPSRPVLRTVALCKQDSRAGWISAINVRLYYPVGGQRPRSASLFPLAAVHRTVAKCHRQGSSFQLPVAIAGGKART